MRTILAASGLALALVSGCGGGEALPDVVYKFGLSAEPITLGVPAAVGRLQALTATPVDTQLQSVPDTKRRWDRSRAPVVDLAKQGLKQLSMPTRTQVCAHPAGREAYGQLADATLKLGRTLAAARGTYNEFAFALESDEIVAAGLSTKPKQAAADRDAHIQELDGEIDALLASICTARLEQARLFIAAGDAETGRAAAADVRSLLSEFSLSGNAYGTLAADAATLASPPPDQG